jgi:hypothetical protein
MTIDLHWTKGQHLNSLWNTKADEEKGEWLESDDIQDF